MNRKFALGCAVVLAVLIALVVMVIQQAPKWFEQGKTFVKQAIAEEQRIDALEQSWQPPSPTADGQWFPQTVGAWRLEHSEPTKGISELNIERAGHHASYRSSLGTIDIDVVPANDLEKKALLERAQEALSNRRQNVAAVNAGGVEVNLSQGTNRITTTRGNRTHVRIGGEEHTRFWWVKGSLFIFRARGAADSERFPEEYLRAVSTAPPAAETKIEKE